MPLEEYNKKRRFDETTEPEGKIARGKGQLKFVVQRHSATRLHYDFRLEMEGVLKSWAVPKGPSLNPEDKRLAMMVEDHPFSYRTFEGTIPEGNYGAGEVEIWDEGTYEPLREEPGTSDDKIMLADLGKESLKFILHGKKLQGEFALVKIRTSQDGKSWLLIKHRDAFAQEFYDAEEHVSGNSKVSALEEKKHSKARKTVPNIEEESKQKRFKNYAPALSGERKILDYIHPMLAQSGDKPFDDKDWIFEIKWDGYRSVAELKDGKIQLYSRNGISFAEKFTKVADALQPQKHEMVLDGEIVAYNSEGKPDFQLLQKIGENPDLSLTYQVFDILWLNGYSTENLPLLERKELLKGALLENDVVKYCDHILERGTDFFEQIRKMNLEGMIAKQATSTYTEGARTKDWLKIKFINTEDVIICGFTAPRGSRKNFGALILGRYENGELIYCGHTGTGFSDETLAELSKTLAPLIVNKSPFADVPKTNMPATWLKPKLVCEIKFTEITNDGIFRHPVFLGIRKDKGVEDIKEADAAETEIAAEDVVKDKKAAKPANRKQKTVVKEQQISEEKPAKDKKVATQKPSKSGEATERENSREVTSNGITLKLTNQNKVYFPEFGITKGDIAAYYQSIAEFILPHIRNRPISLNRFPNGIDGLSFYQKDAGKEAPQWIEKTEVYSESNDKDICYLLCNSAEALAYLNNLGCIDINPWNSTVKSLENPDWMAFDLDPSEHNTFEQVIETALAVREVLDSADVDAYIKTSGSTGLHIFVPTGGLYDYEQVKNFAHIVMQKVQKMLPKFTTLERNLKKRGDERLYLDYLQNRSGQTLASVYSVRPKPGATVSMPLFWDEVKSGLKPSDFNIFNAKDRIEKNGDLFKPVLGKGFDMLESLEKLMG